MNQEAEKKRACGNPRCSVSTGVHGGLTFGSGELDDNGFWEKQCLLCEDRYNKTQERTKSGNHVVFHCAYCPTADAGATVPAEFDQHARFRSGPWFFQPTKNWPNTPIDCLKMTRTDKESGRYYPPRFSPGYVSDFDALEAAEEWEDHIRGSTTSVGYDKATNAWIGVTMEMETKVKAKATTDRTAEFVANAESLRGK